MRSFRRDLLLSLASALAAGMVVVMFATYGAAYWQITELFDEEMVQAAEAMSRGEDWPGPGRMRVPHPGFRMSVRAYGEDGVYFETLEPSMPADVLRTFEPGFNTLSLGRDKWRVYTHVTPQGAVQVAQPDAVRGALARTLSLRMALPELVLLPFLLLFVGWVLQRGLRPLVRVSRRVEDRDASRLDPLPEDDVPLELRALVTQINRLLERLSGTLETHRRFVADAAHELRTPVAALALQVQVARRAAAPETRAGREAFEQLDKGVARASRVVEQLLRLSEVGPDAAARPLERVDLAELARDVVGELAFHARNLQIDLGADLPASAPILGDAQELRILLTNLVDNALRYAPAGTEVTVRASIDAHAVDLAVIDAGPGIPASARQEVFERFARVPADERGGSGLGLAIAKAVVERHGGRIWLTEAHPECSPAGLAACVRFPRRPDTRSSARPDHAALTRS